MRPANQTHTKKKQQSQKYDEEKVRKGYAFCGTPQKRFLATPNCPGNRTQRSFWPGQLLERMKWIVVVV